MAKEYMLKKTKNGSITIYCSLVLCIMLLLIFACMDSARLSSGRAALSCSVDEGLFSLFSNYDKILYEKYGLLFLDAGFGEDQLKIGNLVDETTEYTEKVLSPTLGIFGTSPEKLYRISIDSAEVLGYVLATDSNYSVLTDQICEIMLQKLGADAIKQLEDTVSTLSGAVNEYELESEDEIEELTEKYEAQKELAEQMKEETESTYEGDGAVAETNVDNIEIPEDYKNPVDNITKLMKLGLMSFVIPQDKTLSSASFDTGNMVSSRTLKQGLGLMPKEESKISEKMAISEFALDFFTNFLDGKNSGNIEYQAEYIIGGKSGDLENLKSVLNRILLIREGFNYIYLLSSPEKTADVYESAAIISAILLSPQAIELVAQIVRICWAYAESMMDIKSLLNGGKIPLFKDAASWQVSLSLFSSMTSQTESESAGRGLEYDDYLRIIMYMMSEDDLIARTADMIEYERRLNGDQENFCLDSCMSAFRIKYLASIGEHEVTVNRSYGYDM